MKLIKMFGLAAVAAVVAMAFIGASSAMALESTLLCLKDTASATPTLTECEPPTTVHYLNVEVKLEGSPVKEVTKDKKGVLLNSTLNVECEALLQGTVLDELVTGGPVRVEVAAGGLVYSNCTFGCTVTTRAGGTLLVQKTAAEEATVNGDGFEVEVNCFGFFDCFYNAAGLTGRGLGPLKADVGGKGHVSYSDALGGNTVNLVKGSGCPSVAKLDALFQSLVPVYLRS